MTDTEIRIAIAEACGFTHEVGGSLVVDPLVGMELVCGYCKAVIMRTRSFGWACHASCGPMGGDCSGGRWKLFESVWIKDRTVKPLPDYLYDLNAMADAEATLTGEDWNQYERYLRQITLRDSADGTWLDKRLITATAKQRAEAFLRVKGLWKDDAEQTPGSPAL